MICHCIPIFSSIDMLDLQLARPMKSMMLADLSGEAGAESGSGLKPLSLSLRSGMPRFASALGTLQKPPVCTEPARIYKRSSMPGIERPGTKNAIKCNLYRTLKHSLPAPAVSTSGLPVVS